MAVVDDCGEPSKRRAVVTAEALAPSPTTGLRLSSSGGRARAGARAPHSRVLLEEVQRPPVPVDQDLAEAPLFARPRVVRFLPPPCGSARRGHRLTAASHAARVSAANGNAAAAAMKPIDLLLIMVGRCRLRELPRFTRAGLSVAGGACALAQEQPAPACRQRSAKA